MLKNPRATSQEQQIEDLISSPIEDIGFLIFRIKFDGGNTKTLQIMIERKDEQAITIKDCTQVSRLVSNILDEKDPIKDEYVLEVSSPGIDRPLIKLADFVKFIGSKVSINTAELVENRKKFKGELVGVENNNISLKLEKQDILVNIDFNQIVSAKLVITPQ